MAATFIPAFVARYEAGSGLPPLYFGEDPAEYPRAILEDLGQSPEDQAYDITDGESMIDRGKVRITIVDSNGLAGVETQALAVMRWMIPTGLTITGCVPRMWRTLLRYEGRGERAPNSSGVLQKVYAAVIEWEALFGPDY